MPEKTRVITIEGSEGWLVLAWLRGSHARHRREEVGRRRRLQGARRDLQVLEELPRGPGYGDNVGRRPPGRARCARALRRQVQALEDGRPAHPPEALRRRAARRRRLREEPARGD